MTVQDAMAAGYKVAETAGGDVPLENMAHRADLRFEPESSALVAAWTRVVSPRDEFVGRGIYPLR